MQLALPLLQNISLVSRKNTARVVTALFTKGIINRLLFPSPPNLKASCKVVMLPWHMAWVWLIISAQNPQCSNRVTFSVSSISTHCKQIPASAGTLTLVWCIRTLPGSQLCQRPCEALTFQLHEFPLQLLFHTLHLGLYMKCAVGQSR